MAQLKAGLPARLAARVFRGGLPPGTAAPSGAGRGATDEAVGASHPLQRYASLLPARPDRRVVILADDHVGAELADWVTALPAARVVVAAAEEQPEWRLEELGAALRVAATLDGARRVLERVGPVDVVVNLRTGSGRRHLRAWKRLFFHLRRDGAYVVDRRAVDEDAGALLDGLARVGRHVGAGGRLKGVPRPLREHVLATDRVVLGHDLVVVTKRNKHLLKIRDDDQTIRTLRSRATGLDVVPVDRRRGGVLPLAGSVTSHTSSVPLPGLEDAISYPGLVTRRYEGRIAVAPYGLVVHDHSVLPESFRWHLVPDPQNARLVNVDADFGRLRGHHRPVTTLPGSYYHLDYSNSGHFGHLMTEALAKLWGWDAAKQADPDLKVLLRRAAKDPNRPEPQIETRLLEAYGIARSDLVWVDEPVWVESLVGATPMWHNKAPYYAHPDIRSVWDRLRDGIAAPTGPGHDKIFVSRRTRKNRECRNVLEVEQLFAAHGFEVVFPERLDLADQARLFADARVVAGFGGSGMFNLMYAEQRPTMIVLNHEGYDSRNEHLYAAVLGLDAHYFWSTPDVPQPEDGFSYEAFQSAWEFDVERNGRELEQLLRSLA